MEHNLFKYILTFPQETAVFYKLKLSLGWMDTIILCIQSATLSFNKHLNQTNFFSYRCFPSYVFALWQNLPCVGTPKLSFFTSSFISFKFIFFFFLVLILPSKDLLVITVSIAYSTVLANVYIYSMNSLSYFHRTKPMIGLWDKLPWKDLKIVRSCKGSSFLWRYE